MKNSFSMLGLPIIITSFFSHALLIPPAQATETESDFLDMDLSQLMEITITSVSKRPETLSDAAAAVFVITQDDIHRSGATSIPEALRLAPGLQVQQISSSKWSVSSRGFGGYFSNKLLVLIDGRSVYTPAFSGVYWDMQGTLLEDIDRIEIIRGPGATLWGANAMNGVINIITKNAKETDGVLVRAGIGTSERFQGALRYGGEVSANTHGRVYIQYEDWDSNVLYRDDSDAQDNWDTVQAGFRLDGEANAQNSWTLQGDIYKNNENQLVSPRWIQTFPYLTEIKDDSDISGHNLTGRWQRSFSATSAFTFQAYYDCAEREEVHIDQTHRTVDLDVQYEVQLGQLNSITTGLGYRSVHADYDSSYQVSITPEEETDIVYSGFLQDAITLIPEKLVLTLGSKWEHNDYTDHEFQPSGRILWKPAKSHSVWAAVSRAVRTPSQVEVRGDVVVGQDTSGRFYPGTLYFSGNKEFESEELIAYETGYRWMPSNTLSFDLALFYNDYDLLMTVEQNNALTPLTNYFDNKASATGHGLELVADWQANSWLDLRLSYTYMQIDAEVDCDSTSVAIISTYENSYPEHEVSLLTKMTFTDKWQVNLWLNYVSEIKEASSTAKSLNIVIDEYVDCDLAVIYKITTDLEFMLVGQNLFNSSQLEFVSESYTAPTEIDRSVYGKLTWKF